MDNDLFQVYILETWGAYPEKKPFLGMNLVSEGISKYDEM